MRKTEHILLKRLALKFFGKYADKYTHSFANLKSSIAAAGMEVLFRTYLSIMFFATALTFALSLFIVVILLAFGLIPPVYIAVPLILSALCFAVIYFYPISKASSRRRSIEANLPFAINHMAAIASSGVPPYAMFRLLRNFSEYGEISKEAGKIVRNTEVFGHDITTSLREVASRTPSNSFRELLNGIVSIIETGGNMQEYLTQQSEKAIFEYRLKREKYMETLSTYADFYTAVLIAAPMFLVAILAIMNMIGGELFGMRINDVMNIGIFLLIPVLNAGFILFVHITQPEV